MGLFRLLVRAFFSRPPPVQHRVVHDKLPAIDWSGLGRQVSVPPARRHKVSDPTHSGSSDSHKVTIHGRCYVVDGDTIFIGDASIRLAGIDAPELDHPYGKNAKWALINLCKGQTVHAVLEGAMSHDRTVATCYLPDGRDLSAEMVKLGLAVDWPKFSGGKYRQYEVPDIRRKLWRCDARQKGRMPQPPI